MSSFAPPISRDGFVYHGQLFADAGNLNRHPRASEAEITALLRPEKPAKDQKDKVGHWYIAQLMHYGLPPTQNKNAAKVRLLDALNNKTLKVPPEVKKLEAALKKEYDAANRKAKAEMKGKTAEPENSTPARKRKRDEGSGAIATATTAASKRTKAAARATSARTNMRKETPAAVAMAAPRDRPNAPATGQTKPNATAASQNQSNASATPQTQPKPSVTPRNKPNTTATPQTSKSNAAAISRNNASRRVSYTQPGGDFYNNSPSAMTPVFNVMDIGHITGIYDVQCPAIEDNFLESQNNLKLLLCRETRSSRTWGAFHFPPFFGVIQMTPGPADYSPISVTLGWRARDGETGAIRFGRGCNGTMEFPEPGVIEGRLFGLYGEAVEFWGRRRPGPKNCGHSPDHFMEEWNSFPAEIYGEKKGNESDSELYDRNGNPNPRGRYSDLFERSFRS
ncbi:hypothetical protein B0J12DRAFT_565560 [Macrophomina phaseolina]|uniref:Uncharacterized protein n=1 Tax=Macrophomina phaseolina TaxID=35725 RepID=A0ABQ8GNZ9_9PEZI|nr:hypothetical protein B0J12DRAFT_565560 [Macrophomina phaseolina]